MSFDDIPQELLMRAFEMEIEERMSLLPTELPEPQLSRRFLKKLRALRRDANRSKPMRRFIWYAKRAAMIVLTLLAVSTVTVLSVDALREQLFCFVIERYEKYSQIYFEPTLPEEASASEEAVFLPQMPTYIPEGFEQVSFVSDPEFLMIEYENSEGETILFAQELKSGSGRWHINTEGINLEKGELNGCTAYFYSNKGEQSLFWMDETCMYTLESGLQRNVVYQIARSVKPA